MEDEEKTARFLKESKVRTCSRCGVRVLKSEGCDKMMCRCGYKFCYACGSPGAKCACTPAHHVFWDNAKPAPIKRRLSSPTILDLIQNGKQRR